MPRLFAALLLLATGLLLPAQAMTLDSEEQAFITLINTYRQQNGLQPIKLSEKLDAAAVWMSTDMGQKNYFSHTDSLGRTFDQRIRAFGYTYNTYMGENLAAGNATASATFTQWKNSPGHNANMLKANYVVMGIARVYNANSTYKWYWSNDFGGYDDSAPVADTTPPVVQITSPAPGATVQVKIVVNATASDNTAVSRVIFTVDGASPINDGNAPYTLYLDTATLTNGTHTITVTAFDAAGNTGRASVSVTVNNAAADTTPPTVSITAPLQGATVRGRIAVRVNAVDNVGVQRVTFAVDGGAPVNDYNAPYEYYLDTATLPNGAHTVAVVAYDAARNATPATVAFTVLNTVADTTPPAVTLAMAPSGATVSGRVVFTATAVDNVGVQKVVFRLENGTTVTAWRAPYAWYFYTTTIPNGPHTCTATAYDAAGNCASSDVAFTVQN
jgi:hypothetical protein